MKTLRILLIFILLTPSLGKGQLICDWAIGMGGGDHDEGHVVTTDDLGHAYVTGHFESTVDFDPGPGSANLTSIAGWDGFVAKYTSDGNLQWAFDIGTTSLDYCVGHDIKTRNGFVYITGRLQGTADFDPSGATANETSAGASDIYIAKYDTAGNYIWSLSIGGVADDAGWTMDLDVAGNILVSGWFEGTVDFDPSAGTLNLVSSDASHDGYVAKFTSDGNLLWASSFTGDGSCEPFFISADDDGNCYVTGRMNGTIDFDPGASLQNKTTSGGSDGFVASLDSDGNYRWAFLIGGSGLDFGNGIDGKSYGYVYITGFFEGTVDFDPSAGLQSITVEGNRDMYLAKYDLDGNHIWSFNIHGVAYETGNSVHTNSIGNVFVTGYFDGAVDFDPLGTATLTATISDVFAAQYSSSGSLQWANQIGGPLVDEGKCIHTDVNFNIWLIGSFEDVCDFDPGIGSSPLTSNGGADIFLARYMPGPLGITTSPDVQHSITLYPVPTDENLMVTKTSLGISEFKILDVQGRIVCQGELTEGTCSIDVSTIVSGIYVLVSDEKESYGVRFIKL